MIAICEPICKKFSHEKFNSGFIYGLRLAFPVEKIRLYADQSHIQAIKKILIHDKAAIENIEYVPIHLPAMSFIGLIRYYFLFKRIFKEVMASDSDKVFFLSFSSTLLYIIKKIKQRASFSRMKFTLVLHGSFERISGDNNPSPIILKEKTLKDESIYKKISRVRLNELPGKISKYFFNREDFIAKLFPERETLLWKQSVDFRYIALSHHIIPNARKYIDVNILNIFTVVLPTYFEEIAPAPKNQNIKFAVFGYGNSLMLHNIALMLSKREIKNPYEIRIIGMDNRGTEGFSHITCPSPGKGLERSEMKKYATDIDVFLILYTKEKYQLSCSGSILESLSYCKPILHFDNECINFFNHKNNPIGYCNETIEGFVDKMQDMIENYQAYNLELQNFRKNIIKLRQENSIESSVDEIRKSFTWP